MIVKVEILLEIDDQVMAAIYCNKDKSTWPAIVLGLVKHDHEDGIYKFILGEAYEGGKAHD